MVKSIISSPIGKSFVATAMLTSAVISANATNINTANSSQKANNELVSKEAAKALKANTLSIGTFSYEHNKKLNKLYLENCALDEKKRDKKETLDAIYRVYGTYGATIELQRAIDAVFIEKALNAFLGHFDFTKKDQDLISQVASQFYGWQDNVYFTDLFREELKMYSEQDYPSAEKAIEYIDNHINNKNFFTDADIKTYNDHSEIFKSKQLNPDSAQGKSDLLAYKVHLLNILAFNNFFTQDHKMPERYLFMYYFSENFVNAENSIKP